MFVGPIFVDTHSVEDTSTYICGHSSANQKCCPVSYFDEHLILWVRSINNEIYPNFVTVNDDKIIVAGVECKEEKQSVVWRTYKRRKVSIVSRHILFEFAFRVIFFFGKVCFNFLWKIDIRIILQVQHIVFTYNLYKKWENHMILSHKDRFDYVPVRIWKLYVSRSTTEYIHDLALFCSIARVQLFNKVMI